jgi:hypothetical protein
MVESGGGKHKHIGGAAMIEQICFISHEQGRITAIQKGPVSAMEPPNNEYVEYSGDEEISFDWYIADGQPIKKPAQPSPSHLFNYATGAWEYDLSVAKNAKWDQVKSLRQAQEFSGFEWSGYALQCDQASQMRIQSAVQAAIIDDSLSMVWTLADNTTQTFTASELKQIGQALSNHVKECHDRGRILRAQIDAATTQEELEAIVW